MFKLYKLVLEDLAEFKGEDLPIRQFRTMLCRRHKCPKPLIRMMEDDLVRTGAITRTKHRIQVQWPWSSAFRRRGALSERQLVKEFKSLFYPKTQTRFNPVQKPPNPVFRL